MKKINNFILEKLHLNKNSIHTNNVAVIFKGSVGKKDYSLFDDIHEAARYIKDNKKFWTCAYFLSKDHYDEFIKAYYSGTYKEIDELEKQVEVVRFNATVEEAIHQLVK